MRLGAIFGVLAVVLTKIDPSVAARSSSSRGAKRCRKGCVSIGYNSNYKTMEEAKSAALSKCKTNGSVVSKPLCKVVATFENQCAVEAYDPKTGTPGFGWAIADSAQKAIDQAMANCRDTAGPLRRDACEIPDEVRCDGSAKK
jgi:hypothetical protein